MQADAQLGTMPAMDAAIANALRLLALAFPAALGALAGRAGVFPDIDDAIGALNTYALTVGFPALIAVGTARADLSALPTTPWFWLLWPVTLALVLAALRVAPIPRRDASTLGLVAAFGNVAYLGLPYVLAVFGDALAGPAALAVSVHVVGAVTVGTAVLARWGGEEGAVDLKASAARVARMPLFWAPFAGLALQLAPDAAQSAVVGLIEPLSKSAAPVALFLLGLHLYKERARLTALDRALVAHIGVRQALAPGVMLALALLATRLGGLPPALGQLHVTLAAMPVAITTFSMAHDAGVGADHVAAAIFWSSLLALALLPVWGAVASAAL